MVAKPGIDQYLAYWRHFLSFASIFVAYGLYWRHFHLFSFHFCRQCSLLETFLPSVAIIFRQSSLSPETFPHSFRISTIERR
jgi:hypothetical protein